MIDELSLTWQQWDAMRQHVRQKFPEEGCGLLGGLNGQVQLVIPITNRLHSPTRYMMEPQQQYYAFQLIEKLEMELIGIYHSHPAGPAVPSPTDIGEFYYPGTISLIWSLIEQNWQARGFWIEGQRIKEVSLKIGLSAQPERQ